MAAATNIQRIVQIVLRVVDETKGVLGKVAKNFKQVEASTKEAGAASAASASEVKKLSKELKDTGTQAKRSAAALDKASASTKKLASTKLSRVLSTVRTKLSRVISSVSSYTKSVGTAVSKNSLFAKSMVRIKAGASGMQGSLVGMLGAFTGLAATIGGLIFPITKAAKFERAMSEVEAVSGATETQITRLSARASELGRTTEYTGVQSAQAMKMLAMAGLSAEDIFSSVGHVLKVAHAGAVDLGVAADICTNIMTGFRLESSDLARVNDVLVQTFTNTNSTLEELGHAMAYVAPVAAGLGGNFEDLTATVGLLHNAGIKGTMAGTALRGMLFRLFNPTKEEADLMAKLNDRIGDVGLQIRDTSGSFVGFVSLVEQLERAQVDAAEAMAMFGQRAGPGMAALLGMGSKVLAEYVALNEKAQGRAEEISRVMGQNVVGAFRETKSAVGGLTNVIGKQLLPQINKLLRRFTEYVNGLTDWIKKHKEFTMGVLKVIGVVSALIAIVASLKLVLFAIGPALGVVIKVVSGLVAFFTWGGAAVASFYAAIAAFVAFLVGITFSETFRTWVGSLKFFGVAVKDWGTYVLAEFSAFWAGMKHGFKGMWLDLKEAVGFDVTAQRAELEESLHRELAERKKITQAITEGGVAVRLEKELQNALTERAMAIQEAVNVVTAEYEAQIKEARQAWEAVSKKVASLRTELENLIGQAQEKLGALAESFSTIISRSFAEAETSAIVDGIKNQIAEVERVYDESDEIRKNKVRELENVLSNARIKITASTVKQALAMWDTYGNKQKELLDASLAAQLMAQGEYNQRVNALQQEVLAAKKSACERATEILKAELNKSLAAEESLAAKIKGIQEDIAGFHKSTEEKIRDLRRKGMPEEVAYHDKLMEMHQKLRKAKALDPSQYEEAKRLFDEVKGAASSLVGEIKKGDQILVSEHKSINDAIHLLMSAESGMTKAGKAAQNVAKTRLAEQTELTDTLANGLATITKKYEEINTALGKAITVKVELDTAGVDRDLEKITTSKELYMTVKAEFDEATKKLGELELAKVRATEEATLRVEAEFDPKIEDIRAELEALETDPITVQATVEGTDDVQALDNAIDALDSTEVDAGAVVHGEPEVRGLKTAIDSLQDKTVTVTTKYVEERQAGGLVGLFAGGGKLPGFGGGDRIKALLEAGEFVINKDAVRKYGSAMFGAYNSMVAPVKLALGGFVKGRGGLPSKAVLPSSLSDIDRTIARLAEAINALNTVTASMTHAKGGAGLPQRGSRESVRDYRLRVAQGSKGDKSSPEDYSLMLPSALGKVVRELKEDFKYVKGEDKRIIQEVIDLLSPAGVSSDAIRNRLGGRAIPNASDIGSAVGILDEQREDLVRRREELEVYLEDLKKIREFLDTVSDLVGQAAALTVGSRPYAVDTNEPCWDWSNKINRIKEDFEFAKPFLSTSRFSTSDIDSAFKAYLDQQQKLASYQAKNTIRSGAYTTDGSFRAERLSRYVGKGPIPCWATMPLDLCEKWAMHPQRLGRRRVQMLGLPASEPELSWLSLSDRLRLRASERLGGATSAANAEKRQQLRSKVDKSNVQRALNSLVESMQRGLSYRSMEVPSAHDVIDAHADLEKAAGAASTTDTKDILKKLRDEYKRLAARYFERLPKFASGGFVDSILARLSPGEFVLKADAVRHLGIPFLDSLNDVQYPIPAFAAGGTVGSIPSISKSGVALTQTRDINLSVSITGAGEITEKQIRKWIIPTIQKIRRLER